MWGTVIIELLEAEVFIKSLYTVRCLNMSKLTFYYFLKISLLWSNNIRFSVLLSESVDKTGGFSVLLVKPSGQVPILSHFLKQFYCSWELHCVRKSYANDHNSSIKFITSVTNTLVENSFSVFFPWHDWLIIESHSYILSRYQLKRSVRPKPFNVVSN